MSTVEWVLRPHLGKLYYMSVKVTTTWSSCHFCLTESVIEPCDSFMDETTCCALVSTACDSCAEGTENSFVIGFVSTAVNYLIGTVDGTASYVAALVACDDSPTHVNYDTTCASF